MATLVSRATSVTQTSSAGWLYPAYEGLCSAWTEHVGQPVTSAVSAATGAITTPFTATTRILSTLHVRSTQRVVAVEPKAASAPEDDVGAGPPPHTQQQGWWARVSCRRVRCQRSKSGKRLVSNNLYSAAPAGADVPESQLASRSEGSATEQAYFVYVCKRPLTGTDWADTLLRLGQEHVGVQLVPVTANSKSGAGAPLWRKSRSAQGDAAMMASSPSEDASCMQSLAMVDQAGTTTFDFGPAGGHDFSILKIAPAEIREDAFGSSASYALVGVTRRSLDEIREFNASSKHTYHLGVSDCRDYTSNLVAFLTAVNIKPSALSVFVDAAMERAKQDRARRSGCEAILTGDSTSTLSDDEQLYSVARRRVLASGFFNWVAVSDWICSQLGLSFDTRNMHELISGAQVPFYLGIGL